MKVGEASAHHLPYEKKDTYMSNKIHAGHQVDVKVQAARREKARAFVAAQRAIQ